ncbi:hypothetical protein K438DRAFT_1774813 [Mycena galopus ATCC 62051]|nr:hypothetical protein K438DRAFT_1774813 [Mycena galopus ATCC 62051]
MQAIFRQRSSEALVNPGYCKNLELWTLFQKPEESIKDDGILQGHQEEHQLRELGVAERKQGGNLAQGLYKQLAGKMYECTAPGINDGFGFGSSRDPQNGHIAVAFGWSAGMNSRDVLWSGMQCGRQKTGLNGQQRVTSQRGAGYSSARSRELAIFEDQQMLS